MNKLAETLRILKGCIWGNRFNLTNKEKCKFDEILLFVVYNIDFKDVKQREKFINKVFEIK